MKYKVRSKSGQEAVVDESRIDDAERDGFYPIVSSGSDERTVRFSRLKDAERDGYKPLFKNVEQVEKEPSFLESAKQTGMDTIRGVAQGGTFGLADEISSGVGALKDIATQKRLRMNLEDFMEAYEAQKSATRRADREAGERSPIAYNAGNVAGGIAASALPGMRLLNPKTGATYSTVAKAGAAGGALSGLGYSEADNLKDMALDTAKGAALGAGLGVAAKGVVDNAPKIYQGIKTLSETAKRGLKDDTTGISLIDKPLGMVKEVFGSIKENKSFNNMIQKQKDIIAKSMVSNMSDADDTILASAKAFADKMSDEDVINYGLLNKHEDVLDWVSNNAASQGRGFTAQEVRDQLAIDPIERARLRNLDITEKAREITPVTKEARDVISSQKVSKFLDLQEKAKGEFRAKPHEILGILRSSDEGIKAAKETGMGKAYKAISRAKKFIENGAESEFLGMTKGRIGDVADSDVFIRLNEARKIVDEAIEMPMGRATTSDRILTAYRKDLDKMLKSLDSKKEADKIYSIASKIDEMIFDQAEFKGSVDPYKIKRLLGNTDTANRFRDGLNYLKEFAKATDDQLSADVANKFIDRYEDVLKDYQKYQSINALKVKQGGPSSQAIERLSGKLSKDSFAEQAVQNPVGYMQAQESLIDHFQRSLGKNLKDMDKEEQMAFVRLMTWYKNQKAGSTDESIKRNFELFNKSKFTPGQK
jgi:hypothetical protein